MFKEASIEDLDIEVDGESISIEEQLIYEYRIEM